MSGPRTTTSSSPNKPANPPSFYKFDAGALPDELFHADVPAATWLGPAAGVTTTAGPDGFPSNSLNVLTPITRDVDLERICGIALYMLGNVLPFVLPGLAAAALVYGPARMVLYALLAYFGVLYVITHWIFSGYFRRKYRKAGTVGTPPLLTDDMRANQFLYTERNIQKYLCTQYVWPASLNRPRMADGPVIFSVIPHGVAPLGITAYPLWSKLWNDRLCRWTAAPVVLRIPIVGLFMRKVGYVPAKTSHILDVLTKREENVGIILDGIAGMFQARKDEEAAYVTKRKGIVKIALRAGVPIVPVYAFGHTAAWTVVVDPFGILEALSNRCGASLSPFFGRFGWFLGPPRRIPTAVCLGDPIRCPRVEDGEPTQALIDEYHGKMLEGYRRVFDTHKAAYGWADKELHFV